MEILHLHHEQLCIITIAFNRIGSRVVTRSLSGLGNSGDIDFSLWQWLAVSLWQWLAVRLAYIG